MFKNLKANSNFNLKVFFNLFLCSFLSINSIKSQNNADFSKDTLFYKSFEQLDNSFNKVYFDNLFLGEIYAKAYLNKAKKSNDRLKIATGFYHFAQLNVTENNLNQALQFADSVIKYSINLKDRVFPGMAFLGKGICYFYLGQYKNALTNFLTAQDYAIKNNNKYQLFHISNEIAIMKLFWGNAQDAKIILLSQLKALNNGEIKKDHADMNYSTIFNLINAYLLTNNLDSADFYVKNGIIQSRKNNDERNYYDFVSQSGITSFYQKNYQKAIDSLRKSGEYKKAIGSTFINYYYRGQSYCKLNNSKKAFYFLSKADSIYNITNDVVPEVKDLQQYFVNYYKKRNDLKNQLKYINRLLVVDSIIYHNRKELSESIVTNFDKPKLLAQKQEIENKLADNERKYFLKIVFLICLLVLISGIVVVFYLQKKIYKKRFMELISSNKKVEAKEISVNSYKPNGLAEDVIQEIITSLNKFEKSKGFLKNNITLHSLAETLHTNSNYLSKVINHYKNQNFSNYLTQLRIDYCIEKLQSDETFRKFSIAAIADEIGFNTSESFSKAFYKKVGIYPSYFIKQLEKETVRKH